MKPLALALTFAAAFLAGCGDAVPPYTDPCSLAGVGCPGEPLPPPCDGVVAAQCCPLRDASGQPVGCLPVDPGAPALYQCEDSLGYNVRGCTELGWGDVRVCLAGACP